MVGNNNTVRIIKNGPENTVSIRRATISSNSTRYSDKSGAKEEGSTQEMQRFEKTPKRPNKMPKFFTLWTKLSDTLAWLCGWSISCDGIRTVRQMTLSSCPITYYSISSTFVGDRKTSAEDEKPSWEPAKAAQAAAVHGSNAFAFHHPSVSLSVEQYYN